MFNIHREEITWAGKKLVLETGRYARQADGAVCVSYGETSVLCTAVAARQAKVGQDFFPLSVHYVEKSYAAGKIPGGFFKREGRPSEFETLTSRLIDRPLRPLFDENFLNETQVICTLLEHDQENAADIVALIGASAAVSISGMPFHGPIGAARVAKINDKIVINPSLNEMPESTLDLIVAGTSEGVLMVESEAHQLSETEMLAAVMAGQESFQPIIAAIARLRDKVGKPAIPVTALPEYYAKLQKRISTAATTKLKQCYKLIDKQERSQQLQEVRAAIVQQLLTEFSDQAGDDQAVLESQILKLIKKLESSLVRSGIIKTGKRIDGRKTDEIRNIDCQTGLLRRAHGSALFTRGETQALAVTTLGTGQDEQIMDTLTGEYREQFMLHYNFPPFSVNEATPLRPPGRREIGHGKLAWRALRPLMPKHEDFAYTVRLVAEVLESNGSSSMATVCGSSMSMMDAGVPLAAPCAGIAMGLIKQDDDFAVLADILGDEDHLGDMDFKVAGTSTGITALQMDIKITSITEAIMAEALATAKKCRLSILEKMNTAIADPRDELSSYAPRTETIVIPKDKIRDVIGTGGKVIREICEESGARIDIEDDGRVQVSAVNIEAINQAINRIKSISAEPEPGKIYRGKVVKIAPFGAFVNFMESRDGMVHISELSDHHVNRVEDILQEGQEVYVECVSINPQGKVRLTMRTVDQDSGAMIANVNRSRLNDDFDHKQERRGPRFGNKPDNSRSRNHNQRGDGNMGDVGFMHSQSDHPGAKRRERPNRSGGRRSR